jgi:predicted transposase YbfD/YdcC
VDPATVDFPFARTIIVVRSRVTYKKSGKVVEETRYYISSLEPPERTPQQWHNLIRGHWGGVEIRNHWRRDAIWGEDRSRTRNASALANLALIRNALLFVIAQRFPSTPLKNLHEELHSRPERCYQIIRTT